MPRHASSEPTAGELEILQILWDAGPLALSPLCERIRARRPVATTTVATMLKVMLDKKLVRRARVARVGRDPQHLRLAAGFVPGAATSPRQEEEPNQLVHRERAGRRTIFAETRLAAAPGDDLNL